MRVLSVVAAAFALSACGQSLDHRPPDPDDVIPYANAGTGGERLVGTTVALDGSASFDPDGTLTMYRWTILAKPTDSSATIADAGALTTSLTLDTTGDYIIQLAVSDDAGGVATSRIVIRSTPPAVAVNAGADVNASWRTTVQLTGSMQPEPGFTATPSWSFVSTPAGATAALANGNTLTPSFRPDREGVYVVRLTATTEHGSVSDDVAVSVTAVRQSLAYTLVDAEYSVSLSRFVIVSSGPAVLHLHDPAAGTETTVALAAVPKAVGVSPDGTHAAVAHTNKVSIVNLQTMTVENVYTVALDLYDVVWGVDGRVHCIGSQGFANPTLQSVNASTGATTTISGFHPDAQAKARLHPGGTAMYTGQYGGSPSQLYRYDVSVSPVVYSRTSPTQTQHEPGYDFWIMQDGTIVTQYGEIFNTSTDPALDMTYRQTLAGGQVAIGWAVNFAASGVVATVGADYNSNFTTLLGYNVRSWNAQTFALNEAITLPLTSIGGTPYLSEGRFAAFNAAGTMVYAITRSTASASVVHTLYQVPL